jgi:hypothetical protein
MNVEMKHKTEKRITRNGLKLTTLKLKLPENKNEIEKKNKKVK